MKSLKLAALLIATLGTTGLSSAQPSARARPAALSEQVSRPGVLHSAAADRQRMAKRLGIAFQTLPQCNDAAITAAINECVAQRGCNFIPYPNNIPCIYQCISDVSSHCR